MKEKKCGNCLHRGTQPNESNMILCERLKCGVYAGSIACSLWEDEAEPYQVF